MTASRSTSQVLFLVLIFWSGLAVTGIIHQLESTSDLGLGHANIKLEGNVLHIDGQGQSIDVDKALTDLEMSLDAVNHVIIDSSPGANVGTIQPNTRLSIIDSPGVIVEDQTFENIDISEEETLSVITVLRSDNVEIRNNVFQDIGCDCNNANLTIIEATNSNDVVIEENTFSAIRVTSSSNLEFYGITITNGQTIEIQDNEFFDFEFTTATNFLGHYIRVTNTSGFDINTNRFTDLVLTSTSSTHLHFIEILYTITSITEAFYINNNQIVSIEQIQTSDGGMVTGGLYLNLEYFKGNYTMTGNSVDSILVENYGSAGDVDFAGITILNYKPTVQNQDGDLRDNVLSSITTHAGDLSTAIGYKFENSHNISLSHSDPLEVLAEAIYPILLVSMDRIDMVIEYGSVASIVLHDPNAIRFDVWEVFINGSSKDSGSTSNAYLSHPLDHPPGYRPYEFVMQDTSIPTSMTTYVFFEIVDTAKPVLTGDNSLSVAFGTPSILLNWTIVEPFVDKYEIFQNDTSVMNGDAVCCTTQYDTGSLDIGIHNYTLVVNDTSGNVGTFSSLVYVVANQPVIESFNEITLELGEYNHIHWNVSGELPDKYLIFHNNTLISDDDWTEGSLYYKLGLLGLGTYNYTLWINNTDGAWAVSTTWIYVQDTLQPILSHPPDVSFFQDEASSTRLTWMLSDASLVSLILYLNDEVFLNETTWLLPSITITMEAVSQIYSNFTLIVTDSSGNMANDTVIAIMFAEIQAPTTPTDTQTPTSTTDTNRPPGLGAISPGTIIIIGGVAIGAIGVVALLNRRR